MASDNRPENCRNRLRDEGKPYPRSGCGHCKHGGLLGCPFGDNPPPSKAAKEVTEQQIREINTRLDVQNEVIKTMIYRLQIELGHATADDLINMLEESQNPFEVKDAVLHKE